MLNKVTQQPPELSQNFFLFFDFCRKLFCRTACVTVIFRLRKVIILFTFTAENLQHYCSAEAVPSQGLCNPDVIRDSVVGNQMLVFVNQMMIVVKVNSGKTVAEKRHKLYAFGEAALVTHIPAKTCIGMLFHY